RVDKLLSNDEICCLISAVGVDIGNSEDVSKLRYGKVVILTDADVDGQHIRTLLLTFFYRQMRKLVEDGRIFVDRPPLYKVTQKKSVRYVQTVEEMSSELMSRGLRETRLRVLGPEGAPATADQEKAESSRVQWEGEALARLVQVLGEVEDSLQILERRGLSVATVLKRSGASGLPVYRVLLGGHEQWFATSAEVDTFRHQEQQRLGRDLVVADESPERGGGNGQVNGHSETFFVQEFHEVRGINRGLERLREFGLDASCL